MKNKGLNVYPDEFAENITTELTELNKFEIGDKTSIGSSILEITQVGKKCLSKCVIYHSGSRYV